MANETQKQEVKIKDVGRDTARYWLEASMRGNEEQVSNQIEVLKEAAIHILGTYAFNRTMPRANANPVSEVTAIMELKEDIENEVEFMKKEMANNNVRFSEAGANEGN